ncbi:MAG: pyridoxamine 5'-phosphate oxidase family protein [Clostridia bacterium]|nr:pyridoxamine 5'-phosphate oxidase family protein [Clostridia bacterium]
MNFVVEALKNASPFFVATMDGDCPRVRPFSSVTEFEGNLYICCNNQKEVYKQLKKNPHLEICGMTKDGAWLRVEGVAVEDDRREARAAMLADPTGPSMLYTADDGLFVVFRLEQVKAVRSSFTSAPEIISEH